MQSPLEIRQLSIWAVAALLVGLLLWWLSPVLTPFVVAAVLAYILSPLVQACERYTHHRLPRLVWVLLIEGLALVLLLGFVLLVVPVVVREWPRIQAQLPQALDALQAAAQPWLAHMGIHASWDVAAFKPWLHSLLQASVQDGWEGWLHSLRIGGSLALAVVGNLILIPLALFYFLHDGEDMRRHCASWLPPRLQGALSGFFTEADQVLGEYLRGQILVMLALSVYYVAALAVVGHSLALPIGLLTGMAIFIPYVGFGLGLVLAMLSALLEMAPMQALTLVGVVYGVGQVLEGFVLTPRLIGRRIGLHPLAVVFALLAFGQVLGFMGVVIALPASAVLLVALRRMHARCARGDWFRNA